LEFNLELFGRGAAHPFQIFQILRFGMEIWNLEYNWNWFGIFQTVPN
jgi:hypothetical protein